MGHAGVPSDLDLLKHFSIFLLQYDRCTQKQVIRIDREALEFIQSALVFIQTKLQLNSEYLMQVLESSNPWHLLHLNNGISRRY